MTLFKNQPLPLAVIHWTFPKIADALGLSFALVGGFLLSVEALRLAKYAKGFEVIKDLTLKITRTSRSRNESPKKQPFDWPMTVIVACACAAFWVSVSIWHWPFVFIIWMLTPHVYLLGFLTYQFLRWNTDHMEDGLAALIGFVFLTIGTALQLIGAILGA